jgi:hypothetical protein
MLILCLCRRSIPASLDSGLLGEQVRGGSTCRAVTTIRCGSMRRPQLAPGNNPAKRGEEADTGRAS